MLVTLTKPGGVCYVFVESGPAAAALLHDISSCLRHFVSCSGSAV
jgi:hypothetical protein